MQVRMNCYKFIIFVFFRLNPFVSAHSLRWLHFVVWCYCSFSVFDFQKHGNSSYGSPSDSPHDQRSSQGKLEKSFLRYVHGRAHCTHETSWFNHFPKTKMWSAFFNDYLFGLTSIVIAASKAVILHGNQMLKGRTVQENYKKVKHYMVDLLIPFNIPWSSLCWICSWSENKHGLWFNAADMYCVYFGFCFSHAN